jgi:hypothetical protein
MNLALILYVKQHGGLFAAEGIRICHPHSTGHSPCWFWALPQHNTSTIRMGQQFLVVDQLPPLQINPPQLSSDIEN